MGKLINLLVIGLLFELLLDHSDLRLGSQHSYHVVFECRQLVLNLVAEYLNRTVEHLSSLLVLVTVYLANELLVDLCLLHSLFDLLSECLLHISYLPRDPLSHLLIYHLSLYLEHAFVDHILFDRHLMLLDILIHLVEHLLNFLDIVTTLV